MLWVDHSKVNCPFVYQSEVRGFLLDGMKLGDLADGLELTGAEGDILSDHSDLDGLAFSQAEELAQLFCGLARELQGHLAFVIRHNAESSGHKGKRSFDCAISAAIEGVIDFLAILGGHQHLDLGVTLLGLGAVLIPDLADADCVITRLADGDQLGLICVLAHWVSWKSLWPH